MYDPNNPFAKFNTSPMSLLNVGGFQNPLQPQPIQQNFVNPQAVQQDVQNLEAQDKLKKRQRGALLLGALSDVLRGQDPTAGVLQKRQFFQQQADEERRKKVRDEFLKKNPGMASMLQAVEAGVPYQLLDSQRQQQYKPDLVNYKNTTESDIIIGNLALKPGETVPLNVSDPNIANALSGQKGLEEQQYGTVYTRQGSIYDTPDGNYREILVGDKQQFSGPKGVLSAEQFFAEYPQARTTTSAEGYRYIPDLKTFSKFNTDLIAIEKSMFQLENYYKNVKDSNIGLERLGDQISQWFKTLAGSENLEPEELYRALAEGQLQGLIGANRIDTVGGGVMTEKDAWRVISRLGGDVDTLQNPAVVGPLLKEMYQLKVFDYNEQIKNYNNAVESGNFKGFDKREPISTEKIDQIFSLLPKGVPAGSVQVVINDVPLYQKGDKYYFVRPDGTVDEVDIEQ